MSGSAARKLAKERLTRSVARPSPTLIRKPVAAGFLILTGDCARPAAGVGVPPHYRLGLLPSQGPPRLLRMPRQRARPLPGVRPDNDLPRAVVSCSAAAAPDWRERRDPKIERGCLVIDHVSVAGGAADRDRERHGRTPGTTNSGAPGQARYGNRRASFVTHVKR